MVTAITVKEKIQGLINKSNNITGNSDTTLTDAVNALVEGYGSGDGEPVLTELVVTENGVYDNPIIGLAPITWDGVVGDRVTVTPPNSNSILVKVGDKILSADDCAGATLTFSDGGSTTISKATSISGGVILGELMVNFVSDAEAFSNFFSTNMSASVVFPETGTYIAYNTDTGFYTTSVTFPSTSSIPADGWNKVTVNVAGDIIDVTELPTENIEQGKVYRATKETETEILFAFTDADGQSVCVPLDVMLSEANGIPVSCTVNIVETLPDSMEPMVVGEDDAYMTFYVLDSTGVAYTSTSGDPSDAVTVSALFGRTNLTVTDGGWIGSADDVVCPTELNTAVIYTVRGQSSTIYGIPNAHPVKRFIDGAWVELT